MMLGLREASLHQPEQGHLHTPQLGALMAIAMLGVGPHPRGLLVHRSFYALIYLTRIF